MDFPQTVVLVAVLVFFAHFRNQCFVKKQKQELSSSLFDQFVQDCFGWVWGLVLLVLDMVPKIYTLLKYLVYGIPSVTLLVGGLITFVGALITMGSMWMLDFLGKKSQSNKGKSKEEYHQNAYLYE